MTEEAVADLGQAQPAQVEAQPVETAPAEKMVPQSEVNRLVGGAKQKGYDRAMEELRSQQAHVEQSQPQYQPSQQPQQQASSMGGIDQGTIENIVNQRLQSYQQQQQQQQQQAYYEAEAQKILQDIAVKAEDAKKRYNDFDDKLATVGNFEAAPQILQYANVVDNSGDVLYDLANNPSKIASLVQLGQMNPQLAMAEVQKLSNSIKQNQNASAGNSPEPLRQIKSSNVGVDDGKPSVAAFKNKYY